ALESAAAARGGPEGVRPAGLWREGRQSPDGRRKAPEGRVSLPPGQQPNQQGNQVFSGRPSRRNVPGRRGTRRSAPILPGPSPGKCGGQSRRNFLHKNKQRRKDVPLDDDADGGSSEAALAGSAAEPAGSDALRARGFSNACGAL